EFVSKLIQLFNGQGSVARTDRNTKLVFERALREGPVDDAILLFCCHAVQEGDSADIAAKPGYLTLSDRPREDLTTHITTGDIEVAIGMKALVSHPVVFLNACEAGQINSMFYTGFARKFLELEACSVIGPQTEIPAAFAGEFAKRFFQRFLAGGPQN